MNEAVLIIPSVRRKEQIELLVDQLKNQDRVRVRSVLVNSGYIIVETKNIVAFSHMAARFPGVSMVLVGNQAGMAGNEVLDNVVIVAKKYVRHGSTFAVEVLGRKEAPAIELSNYLTSKLVDILAERGSRPTDLDPGVKIRVVMLEDRAFVSYFALEGDGGLPSGTAGTCAVMFSGGLGSTCATLMANRAGYRPLLCHGLTEWTSPASLRLLAYAGTYVRQFLPHDDVYLYIFDLRGLTHSIDGDLGYCVTHALIAECTSLIGLKLGAKVLMGGLTSKHSAAGLIEVYSKHSHGLNQLYPLISNDIPQLEKTLPSELISKIKAEENRSDYVCEPPGVDEFFRKNPVNKLVEDRVSLMVKVRLGYPEEYHDTVNGMVRALRKAGMLKE